MRLGLVAGLRGELLQKMTGTLKLIFAKLVSTRASEASSDKSRKRNWRGSAPGPLIRVISVRLASVGAL
jgi:hypothetical protein